MSDLETRLTALEQRMAFVDILAIEGEYCKAWDFGTAEEWADLFTPDAVFIRPATPGIPPVPGGPGVEGVGRDMLIQAHRALAGAWFILHQIHLPSIRVQGDKAQALVYFECPVHASAGGAALLSREIGVYEVDYVKTAEGWKISRRIEHAVFRDGSNYFGRPQFREIG